MNIEPENRRNYFISAEMKKVWAVELRLLKKFLSVCEKYDLKAWAEGGTLLGAVREKGYIPWDDDIDMAMPREDFDKLQDIAKEEFQTPYFFQSGHTDLIPNGMAKIRIDNTAAIERVSIFNNHHQGIFIDIFPLDIMPDKQEEFDTYLSKVNKLKKELNTFCYHNYSLTNWKYNYRIFKTIMKIRLKGFNTCFQEYEKEVKKYMKSENRMVSLVAWYYKDSYLRNREWYKETIWMPFEDIKMPIPIGYHDILKTQYGDDYLIPKKMPAMHEGFVCLSTNQSYTDFLPTLRRKYKKESFNMRKKMFLRHFGLYRDPKN